MKCKTILMLISLLIVVSLVGCDNNQQVVTEKQKSGENTPEIVFMCMINYSQVASGGDTLYAITFFDKNGNQYSSEDASVYELGYEELVAEYAEGNLDGKVELFNTCDINSLMEKYETLEEIALNDEYEIVYPDYDLEVDSIIINWYGILYDRDGELICIKLHCKDGNGDHYSKDDRANEIYEWYIEASEVEK